MRFACPFGYGADDAELERLALLGGGRRRRDRPPGRAVAGADAVHADTWVSMGQEDDKAARKQAFEGFTVDAELMGMAAPDAVFMHCLPAYRGPGGDGRRHRRPAQRRVPSRATTASTRRVARWPSCSRVSR